MIVVMLHGIVVWTAHTRTTQRETIFRGAAFGSSPFPLNALSGAEHFVQFGFGE